MDSYEARVWYDLKTALYKGIYAIYIHARAYKQDTITIQYIGQQQKTS